MNWHEGQRLIAAGDWDAAAPDKFSDPLPGAARLGLGFEQYRARWGWHRLRFALQREEVLDWAREACAFYRFGSQCHPEAVEVRG